MLRPVRRTLLKSLSAAAVLRPAGLAFAGLPREWSIHVPFPPGGSPDLLARLIADEARERHGTAALVLNTTGVNGELGLRRFLQQDADGSHFLIAPDGLITINPAVYPRQTSDPLQGLEPLCTLAATPQFLMVRADSEIHSLADLRTAAERSLIPFGSGGIGGQPHLLMLQLAAHLGVRMLHVPYRSNGLAALGVASGEVKVVIAGTSALGLVRSGRLRIIGVSAAQRLQGWPDVPTLAEKIPGLEALVWIGLFGARSAPARANAAIANLARTVLSEPAARARIEKASGLQPMLLDAEALSRLIDRDLARYRELLRSDGAIEPPVEAQGS
jgi:tripartite-type tricarboxylate transporter receptor subunit TctC